MPEWPEIHHLASQLHAACAGARIARAEVRQPKCLNLAPEAFCARVAGRRVHRVGAKGKWIDAELDGGAHLRLNLGMGGEVLLHAANEPPAEKRRALLSLEDGRHISVNFWWFGALHALEAGEPHPEYDALGTDLLDPALTEEAVFAHLQKRRAAVKTVLLNQHIVCGIGNYYIHDILFCAGVHPLTRACDVTREQAARLYAVARETMLRSAAAGGADYERDLYNELGGFSQRLIAYRAGEACPHCGSRIEQIKTGGTSSFICPEEQRRV